MSFGNELKFMRCQDHHLSSPDVGSYLEVQMSGLRTLVSNLEEAGTANQGGRELQKLSEELRTVSSKVTGTALNIPTDESTTTAGQGHGRPRK